MRIMGIDPGYATIGFGVVDYQGAKWTPVQHGVLLTPAEMSFPERLMQIYEDMQYVLEQYQPQAVSIEK